MEGLPLFALAMACHGADRDHDGFEAPTDCDDDHASIHPGAVDPPGDGVDSDCDGVDGPSDAFSDQVVLAPDARRGLQFGHDFVVADVDGDGTDDLFVGSQEVPHYLDAGEAYLFRGPTMGSIGFWTGGFGEQLLGQSVAIAGARSGPEVQLVMRSLEGYWVVAPGSASGYPGDVGGTLISAANRDDYLPGNRVAAVDLLRDGARDVVMECGLDVGSTWVPGVCIVAAPVTEHRVLGESDVIIDGAAFLGSSFAGVDVDGDGREDLAVGADGESDDAGAVYLFPGPFAEGHYDVSSAEVVWNGEHPDDWLGQELYGGDVDGDGSDEVLACAMAWPEGERRGRLYVLNETVSQVDQAPIIIDGPPGVHHLGVGAAVADLDGDGLSDLAVGAPGLASLVPDVVGSVLVFFGPLEGHLDVTDAGRVFAGERAGDQDGWRVRAGDVDGNGVQDLVVAAPLADAHPSALEAGVVYLLPGPIEPW
ncbi:MAG: FG-GAP repeat protein [Alphaproteobacteria bacterium]|nr:FG-GAP repeat protein [Alphaproteobacteria bacterium]